MCSTRPGSDVRSGKRVWGAGISEGSAKRVSFVVVGERAFATAMVAAPICREADSACVEVLGERGGKEVGVDGGR